MKSRKIKKDDTKLSAGKFVCPEGCKVKPKRSVSFGSKAALKLHMDLVHYD